MPTDDEGFRILDFSTPTRLPDGSSWTASLVKWDRWYAFTTHFEVELRRPDGVLERFPVTLMEPDDWSREPANTRRQLDWAARDRRGLPLVD